MGRYIYMITIFSCSDILQQYDMGLLKKDMTCGVILKMKIWDCHVSLISMIRFVKDVNEIIKSMVLLIKN